MRPLGSYVRTPGTLPSFFLRRQAVATSGVYQPSIATGPTESYLIGFEDVASNSFGGVEGCDRPVNPPPTMATSQFKSPFKGLTNLSSAVEASQREI